MRVLIVGGGYVNKGAEAMLLSARRFLSEQVPDAKVMAFYGAAGGRERHRENGICPVPHASTRVVTKSCQLLRRALGSGPLDLRDALPPEIKDLDLVLDISGFASGDQWGLRMTAGRWWLVEALRSTGAEIVFLPQAWGPFSRRGIRKAASLMMANASLVYARDPDSFEHVAGLGVVPDERLRLAPDVAFQFPKGSLERGAEILELGGVPSGHRKLIGFTPNIRALAASGGAPRSGNQYLAFLTEVADRLLYDSDCALVVIPHEVEGSDDWDDLALGRALEQGLREPARCHVLAGAYSSWDLKSVISRLCFLVGSRYHSIVAALSHRVPVAAIGWSHKYRHLMAEAGLGKYVVEVRRPRSTDCQRVMQAWRARVESRVILGETVPRLEKRSRSSLHAALGCVQMEVLDGAG